MPPNLPLTCSASRKDASQSTRPRTERRTTKRHAPMKSRAPPTTPNWVAFLSRARLQRTNLLMYIS